METFEIYKDISDRTNGDIYIGVVGPVRTGKSTFVTKFMENAIIPLLKDVNVRQRTIDELPQSADGKTIMTTQPKFVPNNAVKVTFGENIDASVRLIDCVGYLIDGVNDLAEDGKPRMVKTPWSSQELPFKEAAEMGTYKVVNDHSTIAVVVTNDGSITEIPRSNYVIAEERVIKELKKSCKPFVIVLNSVHPKNQDTLSLAKALEEKYLNKVLPLDVKNMTQKDIDEIMRNLLDEFSVQSIKVDIPEWMRTLDCDDWVIADILKKVKDCCNQVNKMKDSDKMFSGYEETDYLLKPTIKNIDMGNGIINYNIEAKNGLFYKVLSDLSSMSIEDDFSLMSFVKQSSFAKNEYDKLKMALDMAESTGYGVVNPTLDEMNLEDPEIVRQGSKYGVKLKASASSFHIMKIDVTTEVSPMVGSEQQSQFMLKEFESNPKSIWDTNMFGKSMSMLAREGLNNKLVNMPKEAQNKIRRTVGRIVNESKGGIICILL